MRNQIARLTLLQRAQPVSTAGLSSVYADARVLLKRAYQHRFARIHTFQYDDGTPYDADFEQMFMRVNLQEWRTTASKSTQLSRSIADMWKDNVALQRRGVHRIALEGPAGSGITTLCHHIARQQLWPELFTAVLYIDLTELIKQQSDTNEELNLKNLVCFACRQMGLSEEQLVQLVPILARGVLLIFDGYNQAESMVRSHPALHEFLNQVLANTFEEPFSCMLVSRIEKQETMMDCVRMTPEPWTQSDVEQYIDKFFDSALHRRNSLPVSPRLAITATASSASASASASGDDAHAQDVEDRRLAARRLLVQRTNLDWTPLICELVCSVVSSHEDTPFTLHDAFSRFEQLMWDRWRCAQPASVSDAELLRRQQLLAEVAYDYFNNCDDVTVQQRIESELADTGFFTRNLASGTYRFLHKTICEHAAARHIYTTQLQRQTVESLGKDAMRGLKLLQKHKMFLLFLALRLQQASAGTSVKKEGWLVATLTETFEKRYAKYKAILSKEMDARNTDTSVRETWSKLLGLNVLVEITAMLEDPLISHAFLDQIQPSWAPLKNLFSAYFVAGRTPWVYHLILDQAARHGDAALVQRLCETVGGRTEFLQHPMIEAYASRRGAAARGILLGFDAPPVDLTLSLRYGHVQAAQQRLSVIQPEEEVNGAFDFLIAQQGWKSPLLQTIGVGLIQQPNLKPIAREVLRLRLTAPTLVDLSRCQVTDKDCQMLAAALKSNTSVVSFNFSFNNIGNEGVRTILEALNDNTVLTTLSMRGNCISDEGCVAIAASLNRSALTSLQLSFNPIRDAGAKAIAMVLMSNTTLVSLDLSYCQIGDEAGIELAAALKVNNTLNFIDMQYNQIRSSGVAIADALNTNRAILSIDLKYNWIVDEEVRATFDTDRADITCQIEQQFLSSASLPHIQVTEPE